MKIHLGEGEIHLLELQTRMPFKYGMATMTRVPQVFVRLPVSVNDQASFGTASDLLPPKWFTKEAAKPLAVEIQEMLQVIELALKTAAGMRGDSAFAVWQELFAAQSRWGIAARVPPLLANFGVSLVERALIEAVCRAVGRPFSALLQTNALGVALGQIHPSLKGRSPADLLPKKPLETIIARHTIGLSDPLTAADVPADQILRDGLPQALDECIRTYGLCHFKIKLSGELTRDQDRLEHVAAVLRQQSSADYAFTVDGNEQFSSATHFREYWEDLSRPHEVQEFLRHLLFIEQPVHRDAALEPVVGKVFEAWPQRPQIIIDESDATLASLPLALQLGYAGTSHKNCKGVFKGIANACLLAHRRQQSPGHPGLNSGEDLCNQGPIALLQDLAVMATLGIHSVERNGHHYVAGLSSHPQTVQGQILQAHGDLYQPSRAGWPTLKIQEGQLRLGSVNAAPFGVHFVLNLRDYDSLNDWRTSRGEKLLPGEPASQPVARTNESKC